MIQLFTDHLGEWPAGKIGFCWVPEGGVEGQGMIPLNVTAWEHTADVREAHVLAHQWFGNSLTPADMRENWLSDGFATYMEWMYLAERNGQGGMDALASTHNSTYREQTAVVEGVFPLYDYNSYIAENYPGTIHGKGALVLNMLRHVMGDKHFYAGLGDYVASYSGQSVTTQIFMGAMEKHALLPLTDFIEQWVYRPGWPVYALSRFIEEPDGPFKVCVKQLQGAYQWPYFAMPLEMDLYLISGDTLRVTRQGQAVENEMFIIDEVQDRNVIGWKFDPDGWLLKDVTTASGVAALPEETPQLTLQPLFPQPLAAGGQHGVLPFALQRSAYVRAELRDMLGRVVRVVADQQYSAGAHHVFVETQGLARGCYHLILQAGDESSMTNVLLR
jgi:hypothetical protein